MRRPPESNQGVTDSAGHEQRDRQVDINESQEVGREEVNRVLDQLLVQIQMDTNTLLREMQKALKADDDESQQLFLEFCGRANKIQEVLMREISDDPDLALRMMDKLNEFDQTSTDDLADVALAYAAKDKDQYVEKLIAEPDEEKRRIMLMKFIEVAMDKERRQEEQREGGVDGEVEQTLAKDGGRKEEAAEGGLREVRMEVIFKTDTTIPKGEQWVVKAATKAKIRIPAGAVLIVEKAALKCEFIVEDGGKLEIRGVDNQNTRRAA